MRYIAFAAAVMIMIIAVASSLTLGFLQDAPKTGFPEKLSERFVIPPEGDNEVLRKVYYHPDGTTPERAEVLFKNGEFGIVRYRDDLTVRSFNVYFEDPGSDFFSAKLKSTVSFGDDGKLVKSLRTYRRDGSRELVGIRIENGNYELTRFNASGDNPHEVNLFKEDGWHLEKTVYHANGKPKSYWRNENALSQTEETFYESGIKAKSVRILGNTAEGESWYPDGVLKSKFERKMEYSQVILASWAVRVEYYSPEGNLSSVRTFGHDRITVEKKLGDGTEIVQLFRMIDTTLDSPFHPDNFKLDSVTIHKPGVKPVAYAFVNFNGFTLEERFEFESKEHGTLRVVRYFDSNGTAKLVEVRNAKSELLPLEVAGLNLSDNVRLPGEALVSFEYIEPPAKPTEPEYVGGYP